MASDSFAAILQQSNGVLSLTDPYSNFVSITPSDTVTFSITRGVYVANSGTLVVDGGAWLYRNPAVPRSAVEAASRKVEGSSRAVGLAAPKARL